MDSVFHSVLLDTEKCKGCINCIKRCPTGAIRVRDGKANIISERCIDCAECIRICQHKAKHAAYDSLDILNNYEYTVALPPPSLYAQFNNLNDKSILLEALKGIGFDDVYEVATAAEYVSTATKVFLNSTEAEFPVISNACPAVVRLIKLRYPSLIPNLMPLLTPVELAGKIAKKRAMEKTGLPAEKIGCIFITPCPAKVTAIYNPLGIEERVVDGAIAVREVYPLLLKEMKKVSDVEGITTMSVPAGRIGVGWGEIGGESAGLLSDEKYLAADGIENVISVLDDIEDKQHPGLEFVELNACPGGCVGGVLHMENPYIAKAKINKLKKLLPENQLRIDAEVRSAMAASKPLAYEPIMELGENAQESYERYIQLQQILAELPGIDCGSCGAPSCEAFAEDIVKGKAIKENCVVIMRQKMEQMLEEFYKHSVEMGNTQNEDK